MTKIVKSTLLIVGVTVLWGFIFRQLFAGL